MEIFNIVKESVSLVIMGAGVVIAGMALYTWKKEFIGKKKIDLACDIVEQVCNMQDIINYMRNPIRYFDEAKEIKEKLDKEKESFNKKNIPLFIPRLRMYKKKKEIENFFDLKNKAQIYWGKDIVNLFDELNFIFQEISDISEILITKQVIPEKEFVRYSKILTNSFDNDEISNKVQKIVDEFKLNLEPLYKDRLTKWKKLK